MTDRIPDETMREAIKICDPSFSGGTRVNDAQHIVDVARALMARDQRAAEMLRAKADEMRKQGNVGIMMANIFDAEAAAILSYDEAQQ